MTNQINMKAIASIMELGKDVLTTTSKAVNSVAEFVSDKMLAISLTGSVTYFTSLAMLNNAEMALFIRTLWENFGQHGVTPILVSAGVMGIYSMANSKYNEGLDDYLIEFIAGALKGATAAAIIAYTISTLIAIGATPEITQAALVKANLGGKEVIEIITQIKEQASRYTPDQIAVFKEFVTSKTPGLMEFLDKIPQGMTAENIAEAAKSAGHLPKF